MVTKLVFIWHFVVYWALATISKEFQFIFFVFFYFFVVCVVLTYTRGNPSKNTWTHEIIFLAKCFLLSCAPWVFVWILCFRIISHDTTRVHKKSQQKKMLIPQKRTMKIKHTCHMCVLMFQKTQHKFNVCDVNFIWADMFD